MTEIPPLGTTAIVTRQLDGRAQEVTFLVRSKIVTVAVAKPNRGTSPPHNYIAVVTMETGPIVVLNTPTHEDMRRFIASLGVGDITAAGLLPDSESPGGNR